MKVVVIGIDGATWDPIVPYVESGELPGYGKFWNEGLHGPLISTIPYITQPGWKAYSTGLNPGKMGVYFWSKIDWKNMRIRNINSLGFHGRDYWDILSENGKTVAIIDMPSTFPPKKVNGVMISGFPFGEGAWVYPQEFQSSIPSTYSKEQLHLFTKNEDPDVTMDGIEKDIASRFSMAERLINHDLVHVSIVMNDHVSHFMWNNEHIMLRNFKSIDRGISRLISLNKDGFTFLMSDHGNGPIEDEFYANEYLSETGLFVKKERKEPLLSRERVVAFGQKTGLYKLARRLPDSMQQKIVKGVKRIESSMETDLEGLIDWKQTRVIALDEGLFYVNPLYEEEREDIMKELVSKLASLKSKSGKNVYKNILRGSEVYWGPFVSQAPDIVAITNEIYHQRLQLSGYLWASDIPDEKMAYRTRQVAHHRIKGIFGLIGPGIAPKEVTQSIYDISPTILKLFGLEIPREMDGKPII
ncbi:MAG: alkaline phosphatase family protein [Thermoplasmatales archaeon]